MPQILCALELALEASRQVVIAGNENAEDFRALVDGVHERLGPRRTLIGITSEEDRRWWAARAPWMAEMRAIDGRATAFVCEEHTCRAPVTEAGELRAILGGA
jgi:uncharacterized protein YyaL (SSP411 family)